MQTGEALRAQDSEESYLNPDQLLRQVGVKAGDAVADLGCGGGYFVLAAGRLVGSKGTAYGVDVLKTALSSVESKAKLFGLTNVKTVWADVEQYGAAKQLTQHSIDVVLLVQLLSQSTRHSEIFREVDRICTKAGMLVVVDWMSDALAFSPSRQRHVLAEAVRQEAERAGFRFVRQLNAGRYHYALVFKRR